MDVPIKEVIIHEDYEVNSIGHEHDIALLRLDYSVKSTNSIKPICLPVSNNLRSKNYTNVEMEVAGWGYTSSLPNGIRIIDFFFYLA